MIKDYRMSQKQPVATNLSCFGCQLVYALPSYSSARHSTYGSVCSPPKQKKSWVHLIACSYATVEMCKIDSIITVWQRVALCYTVDNINVKY